MRATPGSRTRSSSSSWRRRRSAAGSPREALREADDILAAFPIVNPNEAVLRTALRGFVACGMSWFDAHLWAYAEVCGLTEIMSEDFAHGRLYGSVMVRNPFAQAH